jgi:hypothetical protein
LANPVYAGKTLVFTPHLAAGFGNPAEHHGNSQRAKNLRVFRIAGAPDLPAFVVNK